MNVLHFYGSENMTVAVLLSRHGAELLLCFLRFILVLLFCLVLVSCISCAVLFRAFLCVFSSSWTSFDPHLPWLFTPSPRPPRVLFSPFGSSPDQSFLPSQSLCFIKGLLLSLGSSSSPELGSTSSSTSSEEVPSLPISISSQLHIMMHLHLHPQSG